MTLSRRIRWFAGAGVVATVAVSIGATRFISRSGAESVRSLDRTPARIAEVARLRAHFDSVLSELAMPDLKSLDANQRANRAMLVAGLTRYRNAGVFPHNYDFPGKAVPYFVDRKTGTLCAVANLLDLSGRRAVVDRVAAANNNVWVRELAGDGEFRRWLDDNGLTLEEAERIQVVYAQPVSTPQIMGTIAFGTAAPVAMVAAVTTSIWNLTANSDGHSGIARWTGMLSGAAAAGAGMYFLNKPDLGTGVTKAAVASMGIGAFSMAVSTHSFYRHHTILAEHAAAKQRAVADASISPIIMPDGKPGLGVSVRF